MSNIPLIILGTVGNCLDILDAVLAINSGMQHPKFEVRGFLDDDPARWGTEIHDFPVLGSLSLAKSIPDAQFVNGIGSSRSYLRKPSLIAELGLPLDRFATIIHPTAAIAKSAEIGLGSVILANTTVCANVYIGNQVVILPNSVIGHDSTIEDYSILAAGVIVSGAVRIGKNCYLGANACLREYVRVHDQALIGMGSVLIQDAPNRSIMVGNPARFLRTQLN